MNLEQRVRQSPPHSFMHLRVSVPLRNTEHTRQTFEIKKIGNKSRERDERENKSMVSTVIYKTGFTQAKIERYEVQEVKRT